MADRTMQRGRKARLVSVHIWSSCFLPCSFRPKALARCSCSRRRRGARRRWAWRSTAPGVGLGLDGAGWGEVIGTIAGDDAILVITRSERGRRAVQTRLQELAGL